MKYFIIITLIAILTIPSVYAHHKDDHQQGQGQNQGGGQSQNNPPDHANNDKDKKSILTSSGCIRTYITNNPNTYARCTIIDTESPRIIETIRVNSVMCIKAIDNVGISKVYGIFISGSVEFKFHSGSYSWYCSNTNQEFVYILVEDLAENRGIKIWAK